MHTGEPNMKMKAENWVTHLQAKVKDCQQITKKQGICMEEILPHSTQKELVLPAT